MAHSRWTVTPYAAGLAAVLALGACSGGGGAPAATPAGPSASAVTTTAAAPTTSTAPTTTEDPVLARIPAAARPETMEGAAAYAAFFFEQLNRASLAGDPRLLSGLSAPSCKTCNAMIASVQELKDDGTHLSAGPLKVVYSSATVFDKERRQILVSLKQEPVSVLRQDGSVVRATKSGSGSYVATVSYSGRWSIDRLQIPE